MRDLERAIHREMTARRQKLAIAESCTGGAIAARIVSVPGASDFFLGSIVAYASEWKERFLQVRPETLLERGVVSREVVVQMIEGLFAQTGADYAVAVSGRLGPFAESRSEKNGVVFIGIGKRAETIDVGQIRVGLDRALGRSQVVDTVLSALLQRVAHNTMTFS